MDTTTPELPRIPKPSLISVFEGPSNPLVDDDGFLHNTDLPYREAVWLCAMGMKKTLEYHGVDKRTCALLEAKVNVHIALHKLAAELYNRAK